MVLPFDAYYGIRVYAEEHLPRLGIEVRLVDQTDLAGVDRALAEEPGAEGVDRPDERALDPTQCGVQPPGGQPGVAGADGQRRIAGPALRGRGSAAAGLRLALVPGLGRIALKLEW